MRISELHARSDLVVSFELFPPKTPEGEVKLFEQTVPQMLELSPAFMTCTYGAGGATQEKTPEIVSLNETLTLFLARHCSSVFEQYSPENWIPHISIALEDLDEVTFRSVWNEVKDDTIEFNSMIHNLWIVRWETQKDKGIIRTFTLT